MMPPQDLVDTLLLTQSAEATRLSLADAGYTISIHKLHQRISQLIASGKRQAISHSARASTKLAVDIRRGSSLEGCENLLAAQIRAGQVMPAAMATWEARHGEVRLAA